MTLSAPFKAALQRLLGERAVVRAPLAPRTSIRIGGIAELLALPRSTEELTAILALCAEEGTGFALMGGGSNLLVSDAGVKGLVLRLSGPGEGAPASVAEGDEGRLQFTLWAGEPTSRLVSLARGHGCAGAEFLAGIPGTIGGAVAMNAGTKGGSLGNLCTEVGLCGPEGTSVLPAQTLRFGYRNAALPPGGVVAWARFELERASPEELARTGEALEGELLRRRETQPLEHQSFGSVFRNPPGDHAGRLIEACGLKGRREGRARFSELHANFIVNAGGATARDVLSLMALAHGEVKERFGAALLAEVRLLGEFESGLLPPCFPRHTERSL